MSLILAIDTETTGFGKNDRIVEIGCILFDTETNYIVGEFETLVNPLRNVPEEASTVHGLTANHLSLAPTFAEVADGLLRLIGENTVLAHNASFDLRLISQEFERLGIQLEVSSQICTYKASGLSLGVACAQIEHPLNHHSALDDARGALAVWLSMDGRNFGELAQPDKAVLPLSFRTLTRSQIGLIPVDRRVTAFSFHQINFQEFDGENAYLGALDTFLRDLHLNKDELAGLSELAQASGISEQREKELQNVYLDKLASAALRDGIVTEVESDYFAKIAHALDLQRRLEPTSRNSTLPSPGSIVCVTGTTTVDGVHFSKAVIADFMSRHGYKFTDQISKSGDVALLLQEAEGSQSSKIAKAQAWGIPRMLISDFVSLLRS